MDLDYQLAVRILSLGELCSIKQHKVAVQFLKFLPVVNWGGILVERMALSGLMHHALKKYRQTSNNKDNEIGWLLLSTIDTEKLRVTNHHLKTKSERQVASFIAYEEALITCSGRTEKAEVSPRT